MTNNESLKQELEVATIESLNWIESQKLEILGVNLFKTLAYELIQVLNHKYLEERLPEE